LVLGGTFTDLLLAQQADINRAALRTDPVIGLFGFQPMRRDGPLAQPEVRAILSRAIDREMLVASLDVTGLVPRATLLQGGLDVLAGFDIPTWVDRPIAERRPALASALSARTGTETLKVSLFIPAGPGGNMLFARIAADWRAIGVEASRADDAADADFVLVDKVAPFAGASWFVRYFRCGAVPVCSAQADELLTEARKSLAIESRQRQLVEAARLMDREELFMPLAAPIRWSLVAPSVTGFAPNPLGRHPLTDLKRPLPAESAQ